MSVQRRGRRVPCAWHPPHDQLGLGAGGGDVELAQLLARVLLGGELGGLPHTSAAADVDTPRAVAVVVERVLVASRVEVAQRRGVDHRELQPLAGVDRHEVHRGGVAVHPADPVRGHRVEVLGPLPGQPGREDAGRGPALGGGLVQQLRRMPQVGEQPSPVRAAEYARGQPAVGARELEDRRRAPLAQHVGPSAQGLRVLRRHGVAAAVEVLGGAAEERGQGRRPDEGRSVRLGHRLEQGQPGPSGRRAEDRAGADENRGDASPLERRRHDGQLRPDVREDRDVAWLQRLAVERRARGQQPGHVVGEVLGDDLPQPPDREPFVAGGAERRAVDDPQPERVRLRRADEAGARPGGGDRPDEDLRVSELGALEQRGEPVDEGGVAAVVRGERGAPGRGAGGREVGDDVAAAERVDRLLRVADEDHRRVAGEGAVEDLPLHRVGVLELVDEHHPPALPHPAAGRRRLVGQRVGELAQQVVVAEDAEPSLAPVELGPHRSRERHPPPGGGVPGRRRGLQPGLRVTGGGRGDGARLGAVELGNRWLAGEPAHVQVVHHLGDELVEVLDEPRAGVGVAGDPQPGQHHLAELVGRRDGGAVERGEGLAYPRVTGGDLVRAAGEQQPQQWLDPRVRRGRGQGRVDGEDAFGGDQLLADPQPQLLAGRPPERHDQQLVETAVPLGDVAGHQGRDGPRLAGAGARLQQRGPRRERAGDVEDLHGHRPPSRSLSSNGPHTRTAYAPSRLPCRVGSSSSCGFPEILANEQVSPNTVPKARSRFSANGSA